MAPGARLDVGNAPGSFLISYDGTSDAVVLSDFAPSLAGDFDLDSDVDGLDFLKWQRGFGSTYDSNDLADWETNYGMTAPLVAASAAVPEPATGILLVLGMVTMLAGRRTAVSKLNCS